MHPVTGSSSPSGGQSPVSILAPDKLVAWCIVPFDIHDSEECSERMRPYLLCLNLNGILPSVTNLTFRRHEMDAEQSLRENLERLRKLTGEGWQ